MFSRAAGSVFGGSDMCMVVTDVGEVGLVEDMVSVGSIAGGFGDGLGRDSCSGIVVRQAVESVLPNPLLPRSVDDNFSFVMVNFGWRMGAKMSCPILWLREMVIGLGERLWMIACISPQ